MKVAAEPALERVDGGTLRISVCRKACPPAERPCGTDCPFLADEIALVDELRLDSARLRFLPELVYLDALSRGELSLVRGGAEAHLGAELAGVSSPEGPLGSRRRAESLLVRAGPVERRFPSESWTRAWIEVCRAADARRTRRVGREYNASVEWSPRREIDSGQRRRRAPTVRAGRTVLAGELPESAAEEALAVPAGAPESAPLIDVVWHDREGLRAAKDLARAESAREIVFFLAGNFLLDVERARGFTAVRRVIAASNYEASDATVATVTPSACQAATRLARDEGLEIVGLLHTHVLEMPAARDQRAELSAPGDVSSARHDSGPVESNAALPQGSGLFYSSIDARDHQLMFPSAWSIGAVLNVRPESAVDLGIFARDAGGEFRPLKSFFVSTSE